MKINNRRNADNRDTILSINNVVKDVDTDNDNDSTNSTSELLNLRQLRNRVKLLKKKPQPEQRTPEWYKQRQTRITASEAASCLYKSRLVCEDYVSEFGLTNFKYKEHEPLNPYETKEDYIIKKCDAFNGEQVFKDNPFTLWGKKYEDVAGRLYKKIYNTNVHEFGLLSHSRFKWLAASPDGITDDGIMLEIKCPKSRKIDPSAPPLYYWIQVQIQLESTGLDFCDFLECEIEELPDEQTFLSKIPGEKQDIGIILQIEFINEPKFLYPPVQLTSHLDFIEWKNEILQTNPHYKPIYFCITKYNVIRIRRSKTWFSKVKSEIYETWKLVTRLQQNPEDFQKYKQSIHMLKNKDYIDKWHKTTCMIDEDDSEFIMDNELNESEITTQQDTQQIHNTITITQPIQQTLESMNIDCMIATTEESA